MKEAAEEMLKEMCHRALVTVVPETISEHLFGKQQNKKKKKNKKKK